MQCVARPYARAAVLLSALCVTACRTRAEAAAGRPTPVASDWSGSHTAPAPVAAVGAKVPRDAWVLHVGDSFVGGSFQRYLEPRFHAVGARYVVRSRESTYTTTWSHDAEFDALLSRRPSLVIVTLGANEFDIEKPEQHARAIEGIARKVARSGATCVWTSPPMWTKDTGIVQVIHDHCAPCLFFDSDAALGGGLAPSERHGDRIHPNERGGERWADAFWKWLTDHRAPDAGPWRLVPFEPRGT